MAAHTFSSHFAHAKSFYFLFFFLPFLPHVGNGFFVLHSRLGAKPCRSDVFIAKAFLSPTRGQKIRGTVAEGNASAPEDGIGKGGSSQPIPTIKPISAIVRKSGTKDTQVITATTGEGGLNRPGETGFSKNTGIPSDARLGCLQKWTRSNQHP